MDDVQRWSVAGEATGAVDGEWVRFSDMKEREEQIETEAYNKGLSDMAMEFSRLGCGPKTRREIRAERIAIAKRLLLIALKINEQSPESAKTLLDYVEGVIATMEREDKEAHNDS